MKNVLQHIIKQNKERERQAAIARQAEIDNPSTHDNRRNFLKKTALGGIALTSLAGLSFEDSMAQTTSKVRKTSAPSELKITDLRYCLTAVMGGTAIIRIDTNQAFMDWGKFGMPQTPVMP